MGEASGADKIKFALLAGRNGRAWMVDVRVLRAVLDAADQR